MLARTILLNLILLQIATWAAPLQAADLLIAPNERVLHIVGLPFDHPQNRPFLEAHLLQRFAHQGLTYRRLRLARTLNEVVAALDRMVLTHQPTLVIVQAGNQELVNQRRLPAYDFEEPVRLLNDLTTSLKARGVRVAIVSVTPVDDGSTPDRLVYPTDGLRTTLDLSRAVAAKHDSPFADVFTQAIGWPMAGPPGLKLNYGAEHYERSWKLLLDQWRFLPEPNASVSIDAASRTIIQSLDVTVSGLGADSDHPAFTLEPAAAAGPVMLRVLGLPPSRYVLETDGSPVSLVAASDLERGVDLRGRFTHRVGDDELMAELRRGHETFHALNQAIDYELPAWVHVPDFDAQKAAALQAQREALTRHDAAVREALKPLPLRVRIVPRPDERP